MPHSITSVVEETGSGAIYRYETTCNSLAYTAYLLAQHTDIQEKIRSEVSSVLREHVRPLFSLLLLCLKLGFRYNAALYHGAAEKCPIAKMRQSKHIHIIIKIITFTPVIICLLS